MNRRFEDKLAELAFGDLSPEEAAKLEREMGADPKAMAALSTYREMREGLKGLSEVPEDQLSRERLRDAILTQGLKPAPVPAPANRSWLWMPATACLLGFALMVSLNFARKPHRDTQIVLGGRLPGLALETHKEPLALSGPSGQSPTFGPFLQKPTVVAKAPAEERHDPNEADVRLTANNDLADSAYDPDLGNPPAPDPRDASLQTPSKATVQADAAGSGPIVLIGPDTDQQTGACKATEVGNSSNVLVGG